jgi:DNA (cytosine-5)-methyltransferase 1
MSATQPPSDKPHRVLDLFCGAGGAAMGLHRAWPDAEIVGVDIKPQPRYPFKFVQADAMEFPLGGFDFIWASPPCQGYSIMRKLPWLRHKTYPLLIAPTRERLIATGTPYCIENVMGAKWRRTSPEGMQAGWLCGTMFGLQFFRHRLLETSFLWLQPYHPTHNGIVRNGRKLGARARDIVFSEAGYGHAAGIQKVREAMQIDWMTREEITQVVPPAYSEYIARQWRPL